MLQSKLSKLAVFAATGVLATITAISPAVAAPSDGYGKGKGKGHHASSHGYGKGKGHWRAPYKGRVIARTGLLLRDGPSRNAKVVGSVRYGTVVGIKCKVRSQVVNGNPRWYLLADGRWAWASARYIRNIGPAPAWC
jgi:hypothetical protein